MRTKLAICQLGVTFVVAFASTACGSDSGPSGSNVALCDESRRTVLVEEKLTREEPSSAFEVSSEVVAFASVVADADFNPSALFPSVATLYLINDDVEPDLARDGNGLLATSDEAIGFDSEGAWRAVPGNPGRYRVWSARGPRILVVSCPRP